MNLEINKEAAEWYKSEMDLEPGDYVQYDVQLYGGIPTAHPNYSLGMPIGKEGSIAIKDVLENAELGFIFREK